MFNISNLTNAIENSLSNTQTAPSASSEMQLWAQINEFMQFAKGEELQFELMLATYWDGTTFNENCKSDSRFAMLFTKATWSLNVKQLQAANLFNALIKQGQSVGERKRKSYKDAQVRLQKAEQELAEAKAAMTKLHDQLKLEKEDYIKQASEALPTGGNLPKLKLPGYLV